MAHGSLSQAGKVKGLTPKVEKTARTKKRVSGRAHKREQYNRMMDRLESNTRDSPNKQKKGKSG